MTNLFLWGLLKIDLVEKVSMLVSDEVKDFALGEWWYLMAVLSMPVEETVDLDLAVEQDKKVVLIGLLLSTLAAHEFNVLLEE